MNDGIRRWLKAFGSTAFVCAALTSGTGCGALKAAANPKVAWAINDPAPMSVVVRRADIAEKTAENVDRVMTDTPLNDDSEWLSKVGPEEKTCNEHLVKIRKHELYAQNAKIVAAEVWARNLAQVEPKGKAAVVTPPAPVAAKDAPKEATEVAEKKTDKKGAKKKDKDGRVAKKGTKDEPKKGAKDEPKKGAKDEPKPAAAAPPPPPAAPKYASVLAAIDAGLGDEWAKVMEKKKALGEVKAEIAVLEATNDEKGVSDSDKKANKKKIEALEKQADKLDTEASKLAKDFVPKAKTAAQKTAAPMRDKVGPVLVNLRQAVDDANISNGAAAVRYPMAATSMLDSAKQMATVYVADVIEEKTGKRPTTMSGIMPGVTLEGGSVQVTINGISASDLSGKLTVSELTTEVASRTGKWVKHALGLLGTISATKEILSFEDDVLEALLDGFKASGYTLPAACKIPEAPAAGAGAPTQS